MIKTLMKYIEIDLFRAFLVVVFSVIFFANYLKSIPGDLALAGVVLIVAALMWAFIRYFKRIDAQHLARWQSLLSLTGAILSVISATLFIGMQIPHGSLETRLMEIADGSFVHGIAYTVLVGATLRK